MTLTEKKIESMAYQFQYIHGVVCAPDNTSVEDRMSKLYFFLDSLMEEEERLDRREAMRIRSEKNG